MKLFNVTQLKKNTPKTNLHPLEISLIIGCIVSLLLTNWLNTEQDNLAEGMIRLHVIANSNSDEDQALKLEVRDEILLYAETLYEKELTSEQAQAIFEENLPQLEAVGRLASRGYEISAEVTELWFPTKTYDHFALPSGEYTALQVKIGEAQGENWWCVAYPPLCVGAASQTVDQAVEVGNFTQSQKEMITGEGYVLKFKSIELWENMKEYFS